MKSSKYIQTNLTAADSDFMGFQHPTDSFSSGGREAITLQRQTSFRKQHCNVKSSEEMLIGDSFDSRQHFSTTDLHRALKLSHEQEIELLCRNSQFFMDPPQYIRAEYGINRSCCSTPRTETEGRKALQYNIERRGGFVDSGKQQAGSVTARGCDPPAISGAKFQRNASLRRMQHTPEIINTHLGHNAFLYDSYREGNCSVSASTDFDKDLLGTDEYGFRRVVGGHPGPGAHKVMTRTSDSSTRANGNNSERRKRKQGDGMDAAEADCDPEQIFELMGSHQRAATCHCSCDHVYNPGYMCLQIFTRVTIEVIDISPCTDLGFRQQLLLNFKFGVPTLLSDSDVDPVQIINGNISLASPVDTTHRISLCTLRLEDAKWIPDKTYLHNEFLCTIIDQFAKDVTSNDAIDIRATPTMTKTLSPLPTATYEINGFSATLSNIYGFPLDAIGRAKFRVKITESNNIASCFDISTETALELPSKYK